MRGRRPGHPARLRLASGARRAAPVCGLLALLLAAPALADAADEATAWLRERYYEGPPLERAAELDGAAIARLIEWLDDPAEAPHHANALLALGASGHPDAYPALAAYAAAEPEGELDRDGFRARSWLPLAFGQLARRDPRALRWLLEQQDADAPPRWHFRQQRGEALRALLAELHLTGLALSGAPVAATRIEQVIEASRGGDPAARRRRRHAEGALAVWQRAREASSGRGGRMR